jgi:hypothetical protein
LITSNGITKASGVLKHTVAISRLDQRFEISICLLNLPSFLKEHRSQELPFLAPTFCGDPVVLQCFGRVDALNLAAVERSGLGVALPSRKPEEAQRLGSVLFDAVAVVERDGVAELGIPMAGPRRQPEVARNLNGVRQHAVAFHEAQGKVVLGIRMPRIGGLFE